MMPSTIAFCEKCRKMRSTSDLAGASASAGAHERHRLDQQVGALAVPELADKGDVGRVVRDRNGIEFIGGDAVEYAAHQTCGLADGALIGVARERALEQEQVGAVHQRAFE